MTTDDWIQANCADDGYGKCREVTEKLAVAFPTLRRVRGFYYCPVWGEREHWWCVDQRGQIVDPTAAQFPSKGMGEYEEWDESRPEPTGKCQNCGGYCFNGNFFCSPGCESIGMAALTAGL